MVSQKSEMMPGRRSGIGFSLYAGSGGRSFAIEPLKAVVVMPEVDMATVVGCATMTIDEVWEGPKPV